jgi:hypothetical protein
MAAITALSKSAIARRDLTSAVILSVAEAGASNANCRSMLIFPVVTVKTVLRSDRALPIENRQEGACEFPYGRSTH